ncbi:MAG: hypothetical protein HFJ91_03140 [Muribaculaceae bacterium]|nr:hypothetical protein [Muribaculaceae bacterium]
MSARITTLFILFLASWSVSLSQSLDDFKVEKIGRQVKEFQLDSINLSSPLDYYISRAWVRLSGKGKYWNAISTSKFYDENAPDESVDDELRTYVLNEHVDYIVTYRDSVASIVTHTDGEDLVLLNNCWLENGRWVNGGQALADDKNDAQDKLLEQLPETLYNLPRIDIMNSVPQDVTPFVDFLSGVTSSPEEFMLDMLATHKLVINGEFHRRKVSWDMLKRLISHPGFPDIVGRVFMELPSHHQPLMEKFLDSEILDEDIIIRIFQDEQLNGWWDRGEFEFLCKLWELNRSLPRDKKIRILLADYQIPYSEMADSGDAREAKDRNSHMADVVVNAIKESDDTRNSLFLVGCAHAYKSKQSGFASSAYGKGAALTAGAQIADKLGDDNVFTIFQHALSGDNSGRNKSAIRGGIFDLAFEKNGNRPVGFELADSPFGNEPFDGIYEIKYNTATGNYAENFDGYLFLAPLENEPKAIPLTEIFTDEFVVEMQRRATVLGMENSRWMWFGHRSSEMTKENIIEALLQE